MWLLASDSHSVSADASPSEPLRLVVPQIPSRNSLPSILLHMEISCVYGVGPYIPTYRSGIMNVGS
jgi:hypothetical protein